MEIYMEEISMETLPRKLCWFLGRDQAKGTRHAPEPLEFEAKRELISLRKGLAKIARAARKSSNEYHVYKNR